jgi:Transcription factor WhiB
MTASADTGKARVLVFLGEHPWRTAHEIGRVLGFRASGWVSVLLRDLERDGQVVAAGEFRAQQGRQVSVWRLAPAGTPPLPLSPAAPGNAGRHRARRRGPVLPAVPVAGRLPAGPACRGADPELFFPVAGQPAEPAKAICAGCPVRAGCLAAARARGERFGIWGGADLGAETRTARPA